MIVNFAEVASSSTEHVFVVIRNKNTGNTVTVLTATAYIEIGDFGPIPSIYINGYTPPWDPYENIPFKLSVPINGAFSYEWKLYYYHTDSPVPSSLYNISVSGTNATLMVRTEGIYKLKARGKRGSNYSDWTEPFNVPIIDYN